MALAAWRSPGRIASPALISVHPGGFIPCEAKPVFLGNVPLAHVQAVKGGNQRFRVLVDSQVGERFPVKFGSKVASCFSGLCGCGWWSRK